MAAPRKRVVVLVLSQVDRDARVQRQIACLAADHEVTVVGHGELGGAALPFVRMRAVPPPWPAPIRYPLVLATTALGRIAPGAGYRGWDAAHRHHRFALAQVIASAPHVIVANDWQTLPIAVRAQQETGAAIVADLHEYGPLQFESRASWMALIAPMIDYHLRAAAPHLAAAMTVNRTIADKYGEEYGIACQVVRNVPAARCQAALRRTDPRAIRIVHHGNASRERRLDILIDAIARTEQRFSLHLKLIEQDHRELAQLRRLARRVAPGRVHFESAMAPAKIVPTLAQYDIGMHMLPASSFNHGAALPNKFFEFMFAGLAICVGPSPEMARTVKQHGCGVVIPSFDPGEIAAQLGRLSADEIDAMKARSIAACGSFAPENEMRVLREVVARVATPEAERPVQRGGVHCDPPA